MAIISRENCTNLSWVLQMCFRDGLHLNGPLLTGQGPLLSAMLQLRHLKLTSKECGFPGPPSSRKGARARLQKNTTLLSSIITNNSSFQLGHAEIQRIRMDFQTFIKNLHIAYH